MKRRESIERLGQPDETPPSVIAPAVGLLTQMSASRAGAEVDQPSSRSRRCARNGREQTQHEIVTRSNDVLALVTGGHAQETTGPHSQDRRTRSCVRTQSIVTNRTSSMVACV
jgi:hypothetical protein